MIRRDDNYNRQENGTIATHLTQVGRAERTRRLEEIKRQTKMSLDDMIRYFGKRKRKNSPREAEFIMDQIYKRNYRGLA